MQSVNSFSYVVAHVMEVPWDTIVVGFLLLVKLIDLRLLAWDYAIVLLHFANCELLQTNGEGTQKWN
jgi:hypothetical protein